VKRTLDNGRRRQIVSPAPPAAERLERRVLLANDGAAQLVLDIEPATEGSFDSGGMILRVGDSVYLTGEDADSPVNNIVGRELWRSDGQSTTLVKDIAPGQLGSNPENFTAFNGTLFFTVERTGPTTSVAAIWKSDGTAAGTVQATPADARELEVAGDALFFANSSGHLWTTDGTAEGTVPLIQPFPSVTTDSLRGVGRTLFFRSNLRGDRPRPAPRGSFHIPDLPGRDWR